MSPWRHFKISDPLIHPLIHAAMKTIAERYVKLVLAAGVHDPDFVDAYYGPQEWNEQAVAAATPMPEIVSRARELLAELDEHTTATVQEIERLRHAYLTKQLGALIARLNIVQGTTLSFDDEARALYDVTPPTHSETHFADVVARLEAELPGSGPVHARYVSYRSQFVIPPARVDAVFDAAIAAGRSRTREHLSLPPDETFVVEFVTDKPWSGYNWYKGNYHSLIQVNTSLPIYVDRAVDLACHEGYPGHDVYNALLEKHLVRQRGWVELSIYPLFSPQSLIAEGTANYGIDIAFPAGERVAFERETVFPLAGLPADRADEYYRIQELANALSYAGNEAARRYLDGRIDAAAAASWLERYGLMSPAAAKQRIRFIDKYRSYVINYNVGLDLVRGYMERTTGPDATAARRWQVFGALLSSPTLPSALS